MPKDKLTDYSATNASNTDVGGVNIDEGMLPSAVNNAIRELMTHQANAFGAGTPLYVDETNTRLGVNNASPTATLDVNGTIKLDGNYPVGTGNVALGDTALDSNVSGASNTAIGADALTANTASYNTAVGYQAGYSNTTGANNTIVGRTAGYTNTTGNNNTYLGYATGEASTGSQNTFIGNVAGNAMTTGSNNTILGRYNGNQGGLDIRTSSNYIVLSDGDGNPRMHLDSLGRPFCVGAYSYTTAASANMFVSSTGQFFRSTSSLRYKNTVNDAAHGLTELLTLRPVTYKGNDDGDTVFGGLIAEEVHDAGLTEFVQYNEDGEPDALAYGNMVSLCIKAIQEQQETITTLTARIEALENA